VSNPIRYDSLLVHYLARELQARLAGQPCVAVPVRQDEHTAALPLGRAEALLFELHPRRGWIRLVPWPTDGEPLADAEIVGAAAPADERCFSLELRGGSRFRPLQRRLVVELHTNHWNLLLLDADAQIVFVLRPREAAGRVLRTGHPYTPPAPQPRLRPQDLTHEEAWSEWDDLLAGVEPGERAAACQRRFAYLGPLNIGPVLGSAASSEGRDERRAAFERWWRLALLPPAQPVILHLSRGPHPYPLPLPGIRAEPVPDLLAGMARQAAHQAPEEPTTTSEARWMAAAEKRLRSATQRAQRLRERLEQIGDVERARHFGDLLLARLASVPRGAERVRLPGWDGAEVEIPLDPMLSPAENASRWYESARREQRAAARIPPLLEAAEAEAERWRQVVAAARDGSLDEAARTELSAGQPAATHPTDAARLPYRAFRTSGGLEVRVGRGRTENDRLTFRHSRPEDIWLHARSVPGSHVILRWGDAEQSPPARDLEEAAGLAAWFSKARTSGLVAVDWTRRKHVRKPRGAAPGLVIPQRVKTLFVEPDPQLEQRMES
jgi:predicted ribosome quality control (RQC) complex YloA/Tae2 family protein